jgi:hypothetical protein
LEDAVGRKKEGEAALAERGRQRETDWRESRVLFLDAASNDHRPSSIRPTPHQRQVGQ